MTNDNDKKASQVPVNRPDDETVFAARTTVMSVEPREGGHYVLWFNEPRIAQAAQPGQFVTLLLPNARMMLRRPFTIYRVHHGSIAVLVKTVGQGTARMASCRAGDEIDVMGPMGHGFQLDRCSDPAIIVAGGTGGAVVSYLARELVSRSRQVAAFAGFEQAVPLKTTREEGGRCELAELADLRAESHIATMRPHDGCHTGFVTDLVESWLKVHPGPAEIFACGPKPMLRKTAEIAAAGGLPCQVSMEERMGCGIGACSGCVCKIRLKGEETYKRVCVDGPVFDARDVVWE